MARGEGGGRPKAKIDIEQLEKCAEKQWTIPEIAAFFRVSEKTIDRRFVPIIEAARQRGKTKLRDLQWARALQGADRVLIHMSKHYLEQHDKDRVTVSQSPENKVTDLTDEQIDAEIKRLKTLRIGKREDSSGSSS
jgi:hypothetical protein